MVLLLGKEGLFHVIGKDIQNVFQNLFKQRNKWRREVRKYVSQYYSADTPHATNSGKMVICMCDGRMKHGGLGDRIRGIVSVYSVCKANGIQFKIYFNSPFRLEDFLRPNKVDWVVGDEDICYNSEDAFPVFCGSNGTHVEMPFQRRWLAKNFNKNVKQVHVYTNANLERGKGFKACFDELFCMTEELDGLVGSCLKDIGESYISVTCRFQQLLGDFAEGNYTILSPDEQQKLMERSLREIERIYDYMRVKHPILLTSDSIRFLDYASSKLKYVHRVPGRVVHMDYSSDANNLLHLKSFADMMMISKAEKVYLLKSGMMYNSGFPRIAAKIGNRPFKLIRF